MGSCNLKEIFNKTLYCKLHIQNNKMSAAPSGKGSGLTKPTKVSADLAEIYLTTDKLRSMVKKWQTLIEAHVDVKTTDGYLLRVFCIGFTQKQQQSTKKHCYAQSQQIRQIRKKMVDIITREVSTVDLKEVVNKLIPDSMSMDIQKACQGIYPLHDVHIRKVKVLKRPRFDLSKLMELHGEGGKATTTTTDPTTGEA